MNGAPAHAAAAIKMEPIWRQSTDPNHFLRPAGFLPRGGRAEPVQLAAQMKLSLFLSRRGLEQWLPSVCPSFPWETITRRGKKKSHPQTLTRQTVTPGCTHSLNSRLKQGRALSLVWGGEKVISCSQTITREIFFFFFFGPDRIGKVFFGLFFF